MPRKPRVEAPGGIHHVVAKGNAGHAIVLDDEDRSRFLGRLAGAVERHRWSCLAYCLLDNHFHLVLETPQPNLGVGMKWLKATYAQDFNHRHGRAGHVFGGRFYSEVFKRDAHRVSAIVYVILNPVRAGVVQDADDWPWSSYAATLGFVPVPPFLDAGRTLGFVDERPDVARRLLESAVTDTARRDVRCVVTGSDPWGLTPGTRPVDRTHAAPQSERGSDPWGLTPADTHRFQA